MAIVSTACLDFDHEGYGRRCTRPKAAGRSKEQPGYPVFQTALQLNTNLLPHFKPKDSKSCKEKYTYNDFKLGTTLCLGNHGSLKVLTCARRSCPMVTEWHNNKNESAKEFEDVLVNEKVLGRPKALHHREYIRGKWEDKPVPVLVLSKSNKIFRSKDEVH
jgi:hypothetical protein